eukprot:Hpha_TRINITY_DN16341_c1_g12::TRINITY_DN16341_c1_g12_i3::g.59784::m.59784
MAAYRAGAGSDLAAFLREELQFPSSSVQSPPARPHPRFSPPPSRPRYSPPPSPPIPRGRSKSGGVPGSPPPPPVPQPLPEGLFAAEAQRRVAALLAPRPALELSSSSPGLDTLRALVQQAVQEATRELRAEVAELRERDAARVRLEEELLARVAAAERAAELAVEAGLRRRQSPTADPPAKGAATRALDLWRTVLHPDLPAPSPPRNLPAVPSLPSGFGPSRGVPRASPPPPPPSVTPTPQRWVRSPPRM